MLGTHSTLNVDGKLCDVVEFDDEDSLPNETHDDRCIPLSVSYTHLINQRYTEEIRLDFLCEKFFISKFYLSRSFEKTTGKSIYQYILEKRMILAKQLLVYGEKPTDIYAVCGFNHYSNFYRAFRCV